MGCQWDSQLKHQVRKLGPLQSTSRVRVFSTITCLCKNIFLRSNLWLIITRTQAQLLTDYLLNFVFPVKNPSHGRPNSWTWTLTFSVIRAMMKVHFSDAWCPLYLVWLFGHFWVDVLSIYSHLPIRWTSATEAVLCMLKNKHHKEWVMVIRQVIITVQARRCLASVLRQLFEI